jgi:hypothetical protein
VVPSLLPCEPGNGVFDRGCKGKMRKPAAAKAKACCKNDCSTTHTLHRPCEQRNMFDMGSETYAALKARKQKLGRCIRCSAPHLPGRTMCQTHLDKDAKRMQEYTAQRPGWYMANKIRRIEQGLCKSCNRPARKNKSNCKVCAAKAYTRYASNCARLRAEGKCVRCKGPNDATESTWHCAACMPKVREQNERARKRYQAGLTENTTSLVENPPAEKAAGA